MVWCADVISADVIDCILVWLFLGGLVENG